MTAYKCVTAEFRYWGVQGRCEKFIMDFEDKLLKTAHSNAFCLIDESAGMTLEDIERLEKESEEKLAEKIAASTGK